MKTQDKKSILIEINTEGWRFTCDNYDIDIDTTCLIFIYIILVRSAAACAGFFPIPFLKDWDLGGF